jgi:hypothetical protein
LFSTWRADVPLAFAIRAPLGGPRPRRTRDLGLCGSASTRDSPPAGSFQGGRPCPLSSHTGRLSFRNLVHLLVGAAFLVNEVV